MDARHKPRLHSVDNIMQTQILGGEVSKKQMDAVHEEALEVVLTALNGEGDSLTWIPLFCARLCISGAMN